MHEFMLVGMFSGHAHRPMLTPLHSHNMPSLKVFHMSREVLYNTFVSGTVPSVLVEGRVERV